MIKRSSGTDEKGWLAGPWDSSMPSGVGFANAGVDDPHWHASMFEIYLVARGKSIAEINGNRVELETGDMLCVEPGEVHTFVESSADYFHFVVQTPFVPGDKVTSPRE